MWAHTRAGLMHSFPLQRLWELSRFRELLCFTFILTLFLTDLDELGVLVSSVHTQDMSISWL